MSGEEFVLSIIAVVMGSVVLIVGITKITGLIKAWINRNRGGIEDETFERLARAFMQHKKDTNRRLQNLEAIVTEEDSGDSSTKQIEDSKKTIEISDEDNKQETKSSDGNLRNMLRE